MQHGGAGQVSLARALSQKKENRPDRVTRERVGRVWYPEAHHSVLGRTAKMKHTTKTYLWGIAIAGAMLPTSVVRAQNDTTPAGIETLTAEQVANLTDDEIAALSGEVIVTEGKKKAAPRPPISEEVVESEELREMPGARGDALLAMKSMPGVAKSEGFMGAGGDLIIRGAAAEDSLYMIDGIAIPITMHFGNLQSVLPTYMMSGISYVPGGFGVEQGGGTAGMVHITSSDVIPETTTGFAELSFINAGVYLAGPIWKEQNLSFQSGMRRSLVDAILPAMLPDDIDLSFKTYPQYYDGQLKVDWRPNYRNRVFLNTIVSADFIELTSGEENAHEPMDKGTLEGESSFWRSYGVWNFEGDEGSSRLLFAVGGDRLYQAYQGGPAYEVKPMSVELREDAHWDVSSRVALRLGAHLKRSVGDVSASFPLPNQEGVPQDPNLSNDPALDVDQDIDEFVTSEYMAVDLRLPKDLRVTAGARMDYFGHIDASTFSPRISMSYPAYEGGELMASLGRYSRPLHLAEAIPDTLRPELSTQAQVGIRHTLSDGLDVSATAFRTDYEDLVVRSPEYQGGDINLAYQNGGTGRAQGAEFMLRMQRENLRGWLSYSYTRSHRTDYEGMEERLFDHDQPHNLVAVASWRYGGWRFGGKFQLASGLPYTPVRDSIYLADSNTYRPVFAGNNSGRLETSHQLDLRVAREFRAGDWNLSAYLDVTNVYANAPVSGYAYGFDYKEKEAETGAPLLPALGVKGEF